MTNKQLHHFLSDSPCYSNKSHSFPAHPLDRHSLGHLPSADHPSQWFSCVSLNPPGEPVETGLVSPHLADEETEAGERMWLVLGHGTGWYQSWESNCFVGFLLLPRFPYFSLQEGTGWQTWPLNVLSASLLWENNRLHFNWLRRQCYWKHLL